MVQWQHKGVSLYAGFIFWGWLPRHEIAGSKGRTIFSFWRLSTMIFPDIHPPPRLHLEILQVSQLHLLPWLGSVSTTCYLTTTTISLRDHSSYSHTLPRPPTGLSVEHLRWDSSSWTSCLRHGASSPHTYLSEASFSTLLNVQLKTKESLSPTPHVLSTLISM